MKHHQDSLSAFRTIYSSITYSTVRGLYRFSDKRHAVANQFLTYQSGRQLGSKYITRENFVPWKRKLALLMAICLLETHTVVEESTINSFLFMLGAPLFITRKIYKNSQRRGF